LPVAASKANQTPSIEATETMWCVVPPTLPSYTIGGCETSYDHWLPEISCCHHFVFPVLRSTAISESVRGFVPGRTDGKYSGVADPVTNNTVLLAASIVTGVQTLPPPTMRLAARQLCCSGGIVQYGLGQAGCRSVV
jgi:hypothetical protein